MPRRRRGNRKSLTKEQIQEIRRKEKNYKSRERYKLKQMELFFIEYDQICKKYGCFILSFYGCYVSKQKRGEKNRTIKSHLESLRRYLNDEY